MAKRGDAPQSSACAVVSVRQCRGIRSLIVCRHAVVLVTGVGAAVGAGRRAVVLVLFDF